VEGGGGGEGKSAILAAIFGFFLGIIAAVVGIDILRLVRYNVWCRFRRGERYRQERCPTQGYDEDEVELVAHGYVLKINELCWDPEGPLSLKCVPKRIRYSIVHLVGGHPLERPQHSMIVGIGEVGPIHELFNEGLDKGR